MIKGFFGQVTRGWGELRTNPPICKKPYNFIFLSRDLKNEIKILRFLQRQDQPSEIKEICDRLNLPDKKQVMRVLYHLQNQGFAALYRRHGRMGVLRLEIDPVDITTAGIKHLENRVPNWLKSYMPIGIAIIALGVSIIALIG